MHVAHCFFCTLNALESLCFDTKLKSQRKISFSNPPFRECADRWEGCPPPPGSHAANQRCGKVRPSLPWETSDLAWMADLPAPTEVRLECPERTSRITPVWRFRLHFGLEQPRHRML